MGFRNLQEKLVNPIDFFSTPMMLILQSMVILWQCLKNSSNWTNFSQNFAPIMEKEVLSELWKSKRFWMFSLFAQGKNYDWIIRQSQLLFRQKFWSEFFNISSVIFFCWDEKFVSAIEISFFNNFYWKKTHTVVWLQSDHS